RALLSQGVHPDVSDRPTPLIAAVTAYPRTERQLEIVRLLLAAGAKVNRQVDNGRTALMFAADFPDVEAVRMLLEAGADHNLVDQRGASPLLYSLQSYSNENVYFEIMRLLLAKGANPNV